MAIVVYIVTREERDPQTGEMRTSVWPPFLDQEMALAFLRRHTTARTRESLGDTTASPEVRFSPPIRHEGEIVRAGGTEAAPVMVPAPAIGCCVLEQKLHTKATGYAPGWATFRVTQMQVVGS